MPKCRTSVIGIQIVYCENGEEYSVWLDLKRVHALAWCEEEVKAKGNGAGGNDRLPTDPNGPGNCPQQVATDVPLCWWDGNQWICGEEV